MKLSINLNVFGIKIFVSIQKSQVSEKNGIMFHQMLELNSNISL